jgi:YcaO-like protein with predicted kinase domain
MNISGPVSYSDRSLAPIETWERIKPLLPLLGITRVSRLTGLDRIGIPVWNAVTPNARSIVISQGKGINDIDAKVSAAMEAIERAVAACPDLPIVTSTRAALVLRGCVAHCLNELIAPDALDVLENETIEWAEAEDLLNQHPCYLPYSALLLDRTVDTPRFWQSSDGLASGNTRSEAILHGLLERIERDAYTLWQMTPISLRRPIRPVSLGDAVVDALVEKITNAGFFVVLFDMTTDVGVPCYTALLAPQNFKIRQDLKFFEVNMGSGAHPNAMRAVIRAITEAAQSRMTFVSGARDDIPDDAFTRLCPIDTRACLELVASDDDRAFEYVEGPVETLLQWVLQKLRTAGISIVAAADLGGSSLPVAVVKVIVPELENPEGGRKRRFGQRALLRAMAVR